MSYLQRAVLILWLVVILLAAILAAPAFAREPVRVLSHHLNTYEVSASFNRQWGENKQVVFIIIDDRGDKHEIKATLDESVDGQSTWDYETDECRTWTLYWKSIKVWQAKKNTWKVFPIEQSYSIRCEVMGD